MVISHGVVLAATLGALLCLPGAVVAAVCSDGLALRLPWLRRSRADRPALRRLDRDMSEAVPMSAPATPVSIDQLIGELRRLHRERCGPATCSELWLAAVVRAYDDRIRLACGHLGIAEHLADLHGMDREIERVRIEGELQAAGVPLRP